MAEITFETARAMTSQSQKWLKEVSEYIINPAMPTPEDIYDNQKLAFELDKYELEDMIKYDRVIGILGFELEARSLSVILVGLDADGKPTATFRPKEVWPTVNKMSEVQDVLDNLLTP